MYFKLALGNVRKSIRDYGIYFLTLVFGVCVFYAFNSINAQHSLLNMSETQNRMLGLLTQIISGVSVFVAIILGFLIVYASRYLIRRRKKEFGTYLLLGMSPVRVSRIIVYETLLVGMLSLVVGIFLGVMLSQALLYISAMLFTVRVEEFIFVFSAEALILTVSYFAVIFVVALVFNVFSVSRYKLINLINANRMHEGIKLRNIPLSIILFIVSIVLIVVAYDQLLQNGLREFDEQFALATVLVCVGTLLFFYSLSGFLLRAVQMSKRLYYRGLNMFKLRQLSAKINTAFASITLVCMALFLAITATCGGFSLGSTFTQNLEKTTLYDASFTAMYQDISNQPEGTTPWAENAHADDYDMESALSRDVKDWDNLVKDAVQVNYYPSELTLQNVIDNSNGEYSTSLFTGNLNTYFYNVVKLSEYNALRALTGLEPLTLANDEYTLWCDFEELQNLNASFLEYDNEVTVDGTTLQPADSGLETLLSLTSSLASNTGTIIVPDEVVAADATFDHAILNVMYNGERREIEPEFVAAIDTTYQALWEEGNSTHADSSLIGWPFINYNTAADMQDQNVGLSAVIAYLAIYIGIVLLVACAAILALQQLSEAADNVTRYGLLEKIGADNRMVNSALFTQIGIYFLFPLVLALCHAVVALNVVIEVASIYGHLDIAGPLAMTLALFLVVYGGYFLLTYFASRAMVHTGIRSS